MKTITSSVGFKGPDGTLAANGYLVLRLQNPATLIAGGQIYSTIPFIIKLDATAKIPAGIQIVASDEMTTQIPYTASLQDSNRSPLDIFGTWAIVGASPIDLSFMVSTNAGVSFPGAVLLAPSGNQTILTNNLILALGDFVTTVGNATIAGSGTFGDNIILSSGKVIKWNNDTGLSRDSAGVIDVGNGTAGNSGGTIKSGIVLATAANGGSSSGLQVAASNASLLINNTAGAADAKLWDFATTGNNLIFRAVNDASNNSNIYMAVNRAGLTINSITFGAGGGVQTVPSGTGTLALGKPTFQQFTSTGANTFTIPAGITAVKVTIVGAGGAGGGGTNAPINGGGGGSGGCAIKWLSSLTPGNTITATVGTGGTGVSAGTGNAGGDSSISSGTQTITTVTAKGGSGGGAAGAASQGGQGGVVGTNGDMNFAGTAGATTYSSVGGVGGPSIFGGAVNGGVGGAGSAGLSAGAGGSGGGNGGGNVAGGAGANGIVIFEWVT